MPLLASTAQHSPHHLHAVILDGPYLPLHVMSEVGLGSVKQERCSRNVKQIDSSTRPPSAESGSPLLCVCAFSCMFHDNMAWNSSLGLSHERLLQIPLSHVGLPESESTRPGDGSPPLRLAIRLFPRLSSLCWCGPI